MAYKSSLLFINQTLKINLTIFCEVYRNEDAMTQYFASMFFSVNFFAYVSLCKNINVYISWISKGECTEHFDVNVERLNCAQ